MGKTTNVLLSLALAGSLALGWCNNSKKQNKIDTLESELKADSIYHGITLRKLEDKTNSFERLSGSYKEVNNEIKELKDKYSQTKDNLNKMEKEKSYLSARLEKFKELNSSVNLLDSLKREIGLRDEKSDKLKVGLKKLENEIKLGAEKYASLEKKYQAFLKKPEKHLLDSLEKEIIMRDQKINEFKELYEKEALQKLVEQDMNSWSTNQGEERIFFDVKNQNFLRNWKFLPPKLFSIGEESISFKDNDPKDMEAFAVYHETGRLEPLKKISEGDKHATFAYPLKFLKFQEGGIDVYAIDRHKNESGKRAIYKSGRVISRKEIIN